MLSPLSDVLANITLAHCDAVGRGHPLHQFSVAINSSDSLEFIQPYIPRYEEDAENGVLHGAYGPRLHAMNGNINQIGNVIQLLEHNPSSKRAVIQLFDAADINGSYKEIPCTTTMQFFIREGLLHMSTTMRSNDAYIGLPHDVFCFTMLQEMLARRLRCGLGEYYHYVGSMHVYNDCVAALKSYLDEGWQNTGVMPEMPGGDPFDIAKRLIAVEQRIRKGEAIHAAEEFSDPYWADILRLVQVYWMTRLKQTNLSALDDLRREFGHEFFAKYAERRRRMRARGIAAQ